MARKVSYICLAAFCAALLGAGPSRAGEASGNLFPLVDGDHEAVIVGNSVIPRLRELGYYRGPRHFLQHYIEQSTGRKLKLVKETDYGPAAMPYAVFVGDTAKAKALFGEKLKTMDQDSYIVHVAPKFVVVVGASPHAMAWAQFDFAREYLGVDCYLPCKLGVVVPKHKRVLVPVETRIEVPAFRSRAFSALNTNNGLRSQPDIPWRMYRRFAFHHNIQRFITVKEFGKTNPEYFPERHGKRIIVSTSAGPGPCIANPKVVEIIIKKCREYFDENPEKVTISLGMTDGGWCECKACKAMDGPSIEINGDTSPRSQRYYTFLNQVARALRETHPGKLIGVLGYAGAEYPPANMTVERNIIPYLCYTRANWYDPAVKAADLKSVDAWLDRVDQIGIYEYLYGSGFSIPRIYNHYLAEFLRHVARKGPGGGFYAEIYSNHGLDGPKAWVTEKLLWDPSQDVDALVHKWCAALFGKAAPPMERYFKRLEQVRIKNGPRMPEPFGKFHFFRKDRQLELFLPDDLDPLWADIEEARKLADADLVRQRIEYFASTFKVTDVTVRQYHAYKNANKLFEEGKSAKELLAAVIEGDRLAPQEDVAAYIQKLQAEDSTKFLGGVLISLSTELARKVVIDLGWTEVHKRLKAGDRDRDQLVVAAKKAIIGAAPAGYEKDVAARSRLESLLQAAERIAVAPRVQQPPTIDGKPDEKLWKWVDHRPWFAWKSGVATDAVTTFALAYDDDFLYVAIRCPQDDLSNMKRCKSYGEPAWKFASVEIHINPDERDVGKEEVPMFQTIPAFGGGLWERAQQATEKYAITDNGKDLYEIELAISFRKLKMSPKRFPYLRINFTRNIRGGGHSGLGWFPSTGGHASSDARGWVIFR